MWLQNMLLPDFGYKTIVQSMLINHLLLESSVLYCLVLTGSHLSVPLVFE